MVDERTAAGPDPRPHDGVSQNLEAEPSILAEVVTRLRPEWRILVGVPVAFVLLGVVVALLIPRTYVATTTFAPEQRSGTNLPSGLGALAGQFGVALPSEASTSPRFYAELVKSRTLLEGVLLSQVPVPGGSQGDSTRLLDLLDRGGNSPADSLFRGVRRLTDLVYVNVGSRTNIIGLSVEARDPAVAATVANRFVTLVEQFNLTARRSQARQRRIFVEGQMALGEEALRAAERQLEQFYEANRSYRQSPQLMSVEGRLQRQIQVRQEVYLTLRRDYESSRIDEVNDVPAITIIDSATPPTRKSKPRRTLIVLGFLLGGGMLASARPRISLREVRAGCGILMTPARAPGTREDDGLGRTSRISVDSPFARSDRAGAVLTAGEVAAFFLGLTTWVEVQILGRMFIGELGLAVCALALPVLWSRLRRADERRLLTWFVVLFGVYLVGLILTDLYRGTAFTDYARGWARALFLFTNTIGLIVIGYGRPRQLLAWLAGQAVSGLIPVALRVCSVLHDRLEIRPGAAGDCRSCSS